jgi:hypothetical protein
MISVHGCWATALVPSLDLHQNDRDSNRQKEKNDSNWYQYGKEDHDARFKK